VEELIFAGKKATKGGDLTCCLKQRRKDNNTLLLFYGVDLGKSKSIAAMVRHQLKANDKLIWANSEPNSWT
jgi:hypothetical protein